MTESVVNSKKKHPQMLLGECKYEPKKIKMENLIDDNLKKKDRLMILVVKPIMILNDEIESHDEKDNDESY